MIRLLLVHRDLEAQAWLQAALEARGFEVVGLASTGLGALQKAARCRAQVAAVFFDLPDFSGAEVTRRIMESHPLPVVLVLDPDSPEKVAAALEGSRNGATTVVEAPPAPGHPAHRAHLEELATTLRLMHEVPVVQRRPARRFPAGGACGLAPLRGNGAGVVGMVASTGGPAALQTILQGLPEDFPLPILVVQHMSDGFSGALVDWLDRTTPLRVITAESGQAPRPGTVYVAAGREHLVLREGPVLELLDLEPVKGHRPSATLLLRSLAEVLGERAIGVVLTGMGDDGVEGLLDVRRRGGVTLAQDEPSSVVYGMPREAVARGAVQCSLNLAELAATLVRLSQGDKVFPPDPGFDVHPKELLP